MSVSKESRLTPLVRAASMAEDWRGHEPAQFWLANVASVADGDELDAAAVMLGVFAKRNETETRGGGDE